MNEANPRTLVTVIVPAFNSERYIDECATSILGQSYENLQVIFVDDGSKDGTVAHLYAFVEDPRCQVIENRRNIGQGPSRNRGLKAAAGDYICFVDADDWVQEDYIERLVQTLEGTEVDMAIGPYRAVFDGLVRTYPLTNRVVGGKELYAEAILNPRPNAMPSVCTRLYKASIIRLNSIAFSDARTGQDYEFNVRYMFHCRQIAYASLGSFYCYRRGVPGSTSSIFRHQYFSAYEHLICLASEYGREEFTGDSVRRLRGYELYTSCVKKILMSSARGRIMLDQLKVARNRLKPLTVSPWRAFLLLWLVSRQPIGYRLGKTRSIFFRPLALRIKRRLALLVRCSENMM
jgi:glycosyltransferase involved in cell wall biosynthesis